MISRDPVAIVGYARTPIGGFLGELKDVPAPMLGATAIRAAVARAGLGPEIIGETVMGCVLPAGLGQAPGPAGSNRRRNTRRGGSYDRQQDVRLRHESSDARP